MDENDKAALFFFGLPVAGLIYCFVGIGAMITSPFLRDHALIAGGTFAMVPLAVGAMIWTRSSARRYAQKAKGGD
ncbi:MAG: hypothetical protein HC824_14195 [Synechococcales cyanobacterium RM1_1_8]|nr:hypothetical protein [Synechococcales cyanobacterium RM1_1_8]